MNGSITTASLNFRSLESRRLSIVLAVIASCLLLVLTIGHPPVAMSALTSDDMALVPAGEFLIGNPVGRDGGIKQEIIHM